MRGHLNKGNTSPGPCQKNAYMIFVIITSIKGDTSPGLHGVTSMGIPLYFTNKLVSKETVVLHKYLVLTAALILNWQS